MFEPAEVGRELSKVEYDRQVPGVWARLLEAQRKLREAGVPVIVVVSGVEMAGKSEVVNRLNDWLDTRGVQTVAFWDESDEERERPPHWRFWRHLPPAGTIAILLGSWYAQPLVDRVLRKSGRGAFESQLSRIVDLERTLTHGGAVIVKLWLHISRKEQARRLKKARQEQKRRLSPLEKRFSRHYARFAKAAEAAIRHTDLAFAPWYIIDSHDRRHRDLAAAATALAALEQRLAQRPPRPPAFRPPPAPEKTVLHAVDLKRRVPERRYDRELEALQDRLGRLSWRAHNERRSCVIVLEGWDAAGKGGAIRRLVHALDARLFRVIPVGVPTDEERAHHYLWRFWRHLPRAGYFTIYDRSWYGRVLVERVEGFAQPAEWMRAYEEINSFEEQLLEYRICLCKFWLHISPQEQLRRFKERKTLPHKRHKIGAEDWRNRRKWRDYELAVDEMVGRTSTSGAPWTLVAANDKRHARLAVLRTVCDRLEESLGD